MTEGEKSDDERFRELCFNSSRLHSDVAERLEPIIREMILLQIATISQIEEIAMLQSEVFLKISGYLRRTVDDKTDTLRKNCNLWASHLIKDANRRLK